MSQLSSVGPTHHRKRTPAVECWRRRHPHPETCEDEESDGPRGGRPVLTRTNRRRLRFVAPPVEQAADTGGRLRRGGRGGGHRHRRGRHHHQLGTFTFRRWWLAEVEIKRPRVRGPPHRIRVHRHRHHRTADSVMDRDRPRRLHRVQQRRRTVRADNTHRRRLHHHRHRHRPRR